MHVPMCAAAPAHLCAHVCNSLAHACAHVHSSPFSHMSLPTEQPLHTRVFVCSEQPPHTSVSLPARQLLHTRVPKCMMAHAHTCSCPHLCPCRAALAHMCPCVRLLLFSCGPLPAEQLLHTHVMSTHSGSCTHTYLWSSRQLAHTCPCLQNSSCTNVYPSVWQLLPVHTGQLLHTCVSKPPQGSSYTHTCSCVWQLLPLRLPAWKAVPAHVCAHVCDSFCP